MIALVELDHHFSSEADLMKMKQDGWTLERYAEEFVEQCYWVGWSDPFLNCLFLTRLDDVLLALNMLPDAEEYR